MIIIEWFYILKRIEILLKEEAKKVEIEIKTKIYDVSENHFHVKYQLLSSNEEVEYLIDSEEVKE